MATVSQVLAQLSGSQLRLERSLSDLQCIGASPRQQPLRADADSELCELRGAVHKACASCNQQLAQQRAASRLRDEVGPAVT